jgi:hypothetical protein
MLGKHSGARAFVEAWMDWNVLPQLQIRFVR